MASKSQESKAQAESTETTSVLDRIISEGNLNRTPDDYQNSRKWLTHLVDQIAGKQMMVSADVDQMLNDRIAQIDELISVQLDEVMHADEFQKLESSWRGLAYLVNQSETSDRLRIKVLNVSKRDLTKDLCKPNQRFDQSALYKQVYSHEYDQLGGEPYGLLIGDYEFSRRPEDIALLEEMAGVAAGSHAPFIAAANAELFNFDSFTQINDPQDLKAVFDNEAYAKWKSFRASEDSKYVGLCMPHISLRLPYGPETVPVEEFDYREGVDGTDHSKYLWGNAAYAFGARATDAFAKYEWCAAIRGYAGGGLVEGLPLHTFTTNEGDIAAKCPTEVAIPDGRENELANLGFIPLTHYKGTDSAVFMGAQSCNKPVEYMDPDATANAKLSSQLQYTLAVCRFAHFLKAMLRERVGSYMSKSQCQKFLNNWIANYVQLNPDAKQEEKARFPLAEASVEVEEIPGKPGTYSAVARLRPHFQLEGVQLSLRLVAKQLKQS